MAASLPGYRRLIRVIPESGCVTTLLEDDIHSMALRLSHGGGRVLAIEPVIDRMPWNTCPGAAAVLIDTFVGLPLTQVTLRRDRKANCTHLHDLAVLAASHADDTQELRYDIAVSDPIEGRRDLTLARDGVPVLHWIEQEGALVSPVQVRGRTLFALRDWIASLAPMQAEAARLLQWAGIVAHGRTIPMGEQSDPTRMPANCHTFQPERVPFARRTGAVIDFSSARRKPGETLSRMLSQRTG